MGRLGARAAASRFEGADGPLNGITSGDLLSSAQRLLAGVHKYCRLSILGGV